MGALTNDCRTEEGAHANEALNLSPRFARRRLTPVRYEAPVQSGLYVGVYRFS
jgi:hypothetical protein